MSISPLLSDICSIQPHDHDIITGKLKKITMASRDNYVFLEKEQRKWYK
jgi:hypothetical protein